MEKDSSPKIRLPPKRGEIKARIFSSILGLSYHGRKTFISFYGEPYEQSVGHGKYLPPTTTTTTFPPPPPDDASQQEEQLRSPTSTYEDYRFEDDKEEEESEFFQELHSLNDFIRFCNLFPQNYEFDRNKLVQLCVAALLLPGFQVEEMEDIINEQFDDLVSMNLLHPTTTTTDPPLYKLNQSFYDLTVSKESSSSGACCRIEVNDNDDANHVHLSKDTVHASLTFFSSSDCSVISPKIFDALSNNCPKLQTLLLLGRYKSFVDRIPFELFVKLKDLTVLDLSYTSIIELPSSFTYLKSLRYLDVSGTPITRLPSCICGFKGMQTLKLKDCFKLEGLPRQINRLHGLIHLDFAHQVFTSMPPRIGSLIKLQTLPAFIVGKDTGCGINELKDVTDLRGSLCILRLENASEFGDAAKDANLKQKKGLDKLELRWTKSSARNALQILEHLQPHTNIRELRIVGYAGPKFPTWFGDPCFKNLCIIALYDCRCSELNFRSLGRLPVLETLHIGRMQGVKTMISTSGGEATESSTSLMFARLDSLVLHSLSDLEEWGEIEVEDFPSLRDLKISCCPKLTVLPELWMLISLKNLEISLCSKLHSIPKEGLPLFLESLLICDCDMLRERCKEGTGADWSKISHIPNVWVD